MDGVLWSVNPCTLGGKNAVVPGNDAPRPDSRSQNRQIYLFNGSLIVDTQHVAHEVILTSPPLNARDRVAVLLQHMVGQPIAVDVFEPELRPSLPSEQ